MPRTKYFIREGARGLRDNKATAIGTIVTIFLSLLLIGAFAVANGIAGNVMGEIEDQVSVTAYLSDDALGDQDKLDSVEQEIRGIDGVADVSFTSKDQAREDFQNIMGQDSEVSNQINGDDNPLPASFDIELDDPQKVETVAQTIANMDSFKEICDNPDDPADSVRYGQQTVERLFSITNVAKTIGIAIIVALIFVSFVFMNNTIRLAVINRGREISIQRLIGASNSFIRGPFFAEGIICSLIGSALAIFTIELVRNIALPHLSNTLAWLPIGLPLSSYLIIYVVMLALGVIIGLVSSLLAMNKYLKA